MQNFNDIDKTLLAKRLVLETSYKTFLKWNFKQTTNQSFIFSYHHDVLAEAFQGVLDLKIKKLAVFIPPRYSKTEMVKQFCACGFARNPSSNFIYTSYSDALALKCSKEIRDAVTHTKFQELWHMPMKSDTKAKKLWETESDGGLYATSFGGPITGFGAGKLDGYKSLTQWLFNGALIIDDPLKAQDRHRKIALQDVVDYYTGTLPSRFNSTDTPCILIMQRLHPQDLGGWILENEKDDWTIVTLPAINEDGTALWPQKHSIEELDKLKKNNEMFSSQYMQQPIKLGGNLIKPIQFRRYIELPFLKKRFITADTALKDKEHNDYSVFQCWGVGHDNFLYLIDLWRGKIKSSDLKEKFIDFWNKHNSRDWEVRQYGHLTCAYVEDKASGTQLIQEAQAEGRIPVQDIQRSRSKLERVLDILLPRMASGFVHIPQEADWIHDFVTECEDFTAEMSHKHDDQIDPMVDAVEIGSEGAGVDDTGILNNNIDRKILNRKAKHRRR